jgi:archaellum component FlaC
MPTLQQSQDLQAVEQLRTQILVDQHLATSLESGLQDIEQKENAAKHVIELTKDDLHHGGEHRRAKDALDKLLKRRVVIEERIRYAKGRIELAEKRLATFDHGALDRVAKIRGLVSRIAGIAG